MALSQFKVVHMAMSTGRKSGNISARRRKSNSERNKQKHEIEHGLYFEPPALSVQRRIRAAARRTRLTMGRGTNKTNFTVPTNRQSEEATEGEGKE